jgi:SHS family sialic acid transporter-like MFS transporter
MAPPCRRHCALQESNEDDRTAYERRPYYRWLALLAALLAWGFDGVEQGVYGIMTRQALKDLVPEVRPLVKEANELSQRAANESNPQAAARLHGQASGLTKKVDESVGWYFSLSVAMWLWGAACGGVIFGRLGDRYGRVRSMLISVTTYAAFTGLSALSTHWTHIMGARFLGAMGLGGTWPLCVALLVETWPERRRAVLAGSIGAAANVGFWIAATYSRFMLGYHFSWRWVIGMGFFIGLSSLAIIAFVPEPTKWRRSREKKQRSSLADLFTRQYRRATIVGSLLSTVALLGTWGSFLWLATYVDQIAERTAYQNTAKAIVSQWASYGQILGGFVGGLLAGWMGNKKSWCLLCIAAWCTVFALFGLNRHFSYQMVFMAVLAGVFVTAFFGWIPKFLPELYPTRIRATGQGFSFNIGRVLAGFGVLGGGKLVTLFHGDYRKGMMTMCSIYLVGLVIILFAPDTGGKMMADEADEADEGSRPAGTP